MSFLLLSRKVVFIQIEQSGLLVYTYIRLEYPAFLDILKSSAVYLETLSYQCDPRLGFWTFLSSLLLAVKFINWSRTLLSPYTTFFLKFLSFALCLWLCPWLQQVTDCSIRDAAHNSDLSDCKPRSWTISPVTFLKLQIDTYI